MNKRTQKKLIIELITKRYPVRGFDPKNAFKVLDAVKEASIKLEKEFPHEFVGLLLYGSRTKGFAGKDSDVDVGIISYENVKNKLIKINKIIGKALDKRGFAFHGVFFSFDGSFFRHKPTMYDSRETALLFGLVSGKKINALRLKTIKHIKEKLDPNERKEFWEKVREEYSKKFLHYDSERAGTRLKKAGIDQRLFFTRKIKFALPPLEKTEAILRKKIENNKPKNNLRKRIPVRRDEIKFWRVNKQRRI